MSFLFGAACLDIFYHNRLYLSMPVIHFYRFLRMASAVPEALRTQKADGNCRPLHIAQI